MNASIPQKTWEDFILSGLPTRRQESWKYTDFSLLRAAKLTLATLPDTVNVFDTALDKHRLPVGNSVLLVFVNGFFVPTLSDLHKLPATVTVKATSDVANITDIHAKKYPFVALNASVATPGLFLAIPDDCELADPLHCLFLTTETTGFVAHPYHVVRVGKRSKVTLLEEYYSRASQSYFMNSVMSLTVEEEADVAHYKVQHEGSHAIHMAHTFVYQKKNSRTAFTTMTMGGGFSRDELVVSLQETGAYSATRGFYHVDAPQKYVDHHVTMHHMAAHTHSEMLYKGLVDQDGRAVFNGRVHVEKDAQKVVSQQANHNLLLSKQAEVYTKPELEIYADDVKCKHGTTVGQIDQDALFYLRSRGVNEVDAMQMLLQGFAEEVIGSIAHAGIKQRVLESML